MGASSATVSALLVKLKTAEQRQRRKVLRSVGHLLRIFWFTVHVFTLNWIHVDVYVIDYSPTISLFPPQTEQRVGRYSHRPHRAACDLWPPITWWPLTFPHTEKLLPSECRKQQQMMKTLGWFCLFMCISSFIFLCFILIACPVIIIFLAFPPFSQSVLPVALLLPCLSTDFFTRKWSVNLTEGA